MLRFAGFELDQRRAELRDAGGSPIRLRPKTFDMLYLFAVNAGRVVSKQELMEAIWPNVHVGEDSLFQCIREIRTALGDDGRSLIKVVSGRGYMFDAEVSGLPVSPDVQAEPETATTSESVPSAQMPAMTAAQRQPFRGLRGWAAIVVSFCAVIGFAVAAPAIAPNLIFSPKPPMVMVMPITAAGGDAQLMSTAGNVTERLSDGLARIDTIRVVTSRTKPATALLAGVSAAVTDADFLVNGELERHANAWTLEARLTDTATGEVKWTTSVSVSTENTEPAIQQTRIAAGLGHELALRINASLYPETRGTTLTSPADNAKVVVEQALASINQTTRERFATAQAMLENGLTGEPDNVDLQVTLAALQTRGIQMVWYSPAEMTAAESRARSLLERALQAKPRYLPGLEAYCRFLTATNNFVESLVACARVLNLDPWNGGALYQLGLTQLQLGRTEDALATFQQADVFDTPAVSRWTWKIGIGWAHLMLGRNDEAVEWIKKSIAITPASGRPYLLLAAALQRAGRPEEAKIALAKGMALRPNSTALNVLPPERNASPAFVEASVGIVQTMVEVGLPKN
ncbi:winged helix-turn-helix domain-containing protein [Mesorhizobium sp. NPDC059025]|uniref:winged helix-turn-helix domain-containing protein n=1 Tax=unclassified Mesorhizobium TaxID=325217 RepID=UPI0036A75EA0